ncbi:MAG: hypothetical protein HGB28_03940 [Oscillochloris sp.]|nr:hypothetical protein [Oscillochloris sp.]
MQLLRFSGRLIQFIMIGLMGLIFVAVGVFLGVIASRDAAVEADRVEAMAALDLAAFERGEPGSGALVEGVLSARNPARFRDFVAYVREEYHGKDSDGDDDWREDERVTPPLLVDLGGGVVQVANGTYRITRYHGQWDDGGVVYWNGITGEGSKRYAGLVAGRPLLVIGTVQAGPEGNQIQADLVFAGSQAEYVAGQRDTARFLPFFGMIFGAVGLILLGFGVRKLLRG